MIGVKQICKGMTAILQTTNRFLHVTHVAQGAMISMLDEEFAEWMGENYRAVERSVEVIRIFIVPSEDQDHPALRATLNAMNSHGIHVRLCLLESLQAQFVRDFSLYDEEHLVYIFKSEETGPWLHNNAEARYTVDREAIARYRMFFEAIRAESIKYTPVIEPLEPGGSS